VAARIRFGMHSWYRHASAAPGHVLTRTLGDGQQRQTVLTPGRSTAKALMRVRDGTLTRHASVLQLQTAAAGANGADGRAGRQQVRRRAASAARRRHDLQRRRAPQRSAGARFSATSTSTTPRSTAMVQLHLQKRVVESDMPPQMRSVSSKRVVSAVKKAIDEEQAKAIAAATAAATAAALAAATAGRRRRAASTSSTSIAESSSRSHRAANGMSPVGPLTWLAATTTTTTTTMTTMTTTTRTTIAMTTHDGDDDGSYEEEVGHDAELPSADDDSFRTASCRSVTRSLSGGSATFHAIGLSASGTVRVPTLETIFEHDQAGATVRLSAAVADHQRQLIEQVASVAPVASVASVTPVTPVASTNAARWLRTGGRGRCGDADLKAGRRSATPNSGGSVLQRRRRFVVVRLVELVVIVVIVVVACDAECCVEDDDDVANDQRRRQLQRQQRRRR
jgi:hypothetical protein